MYFQIENTPERIRKARTEVIKKEPVKEECPKLILKPFSTPPQVVFENVEIGTSCVRYLEIFNPLKQIQQITLGRSLPVGLVIDLPRDWLILEPETCYCLTLTWTPMQPTAVRETIRFTNENRGRHDVILVLKSAMNVKNKLSQSKILKVSPGKIKKKIIKKSSVCITKKKTETFYNTTKIKTIVNELPSTESGFHKLTDSETISNKENSLDQYIAHCAFDLSMTSDCKFDTSEIFANVRKNNKEILQNTYEKTYINNKIHTPIGHNILRPSNKQEPELDPSDIFDNIVFTPLKSLQSNNDKLVEKKIVISVNSDSDLDDSLDMKNSNKENDVHSMLFITPSQPPNKWLAVNNAQRDNHVLETPVMKSKKIPNTSSPKELSSPNFSINTDFSRISESSFFPQRFSSERKVVTKINNETQELINDTNLFNRLNSDTYTKDSPYTSADFHQINSDSRPQTFFNRDQYPKMCRQSLFKETQQYRDSYDRNFVNFYEQNLCSDLRADRSPLRSLTPPPLQSIPEESGHTYDSPALDKTNKQTTTFTLNRTFEKNVESKFSSAILRQTWSKKSVRAEPELWKIPTPLIKKIVNNKSHVKGKKSISARRSSVTFEGSCKSVDTLAGRLSNSTYEANKSANQNISLNQIGNVYSQSFTIDPFLSSTYYYDEEAVDKFEQEFKRWLNYILTPPSDLDSNVEQKVDVGKVWIENRNKDVPVAPTKEQVSSIYHNSHRLESLRRSARALLLGPEIAPVAVKLNAQIEKKLIAIRTDRNLHLDVGLQKVIMELLLSYNPLWLRIGLEAIYGQVLPLRSNSDIEGLTMFIIQRMFKNPYLKSKNSKSSAPNMLLPAYMEAIKKFTLKKFFLLVFFLDKAKQKKLISHDPCLFCRNAVCKESREVVIRFTRELIAGIGDITKHLRPLGYVVCHKQSYLDEYKYAVLNIALDIRDGVRLTKVMEIILMKNGLLSQLRTPAISRLQKIHNVQVALNALKEANFVIVGDITATDIADGHREKTLSLLWQLIHVFRAPLFVKAASVIQAWWRKKYAVIQEERKKEELLRERLNNAASTIQVWWRRIQYNRMVELKMQQVISATITIQKYFRAWYYRRRYVQMKMKVATIEEWYDGVKKVRQARELLKNLFIKREQCRNEAATKIQAHLKRWICMKRYQQTVKKIIIIQSVVRCFIQRKYFLRLRKSVSYIQEKYKGKLLMKEQMQKLKMSIKSIIAIQSFYRMIKQRKQFLAHRKAVRTIEDRYIAFMKMRKARQEYLLMKQVTIKIQAIYRGKRCRNDYAKTRKSILYMQRKIRAQQKMLEERTRYLNIRRAVVTIQTRIRATLMMKKERSAYILQRQSVVLIQKYFRAYLLGKAERRKFIQLKESVISVQRRYRNLLKMRRERNEFIALRNAAIVLQRTYRALQMMRTCKTSYENLRKAAIALQNIYRAKIRMREERSKYLKMKKSCILIQNRYRAYYKGKRERQLYLHRKDCAIKIQKWFRSYLKAREIKQSYERTKQACAVIQTRYRAYIIGKKIKQEYVRLKTATIIIQTYYRNYILTRRIRQEYISLKTATVTIQRFYRSFKETRKQREHYLRVQTAALQIQNYYRQYKKTQNIKRIYNELRIATINIQRRFRALRAMKMQKLKFLQLKHSVIVIQSKYRALIAMKSQRKLYTELRRAVITVQQRYKAQISMKKERTKYLTIIESCKKIQRFYRAYVIGRKQRFSYLKLKHATVKIQQMYRALLETRKTRTDYLTLRSSVVLIQRKFRARALMLDERKRYISTLKAVVTIQRYYRSHILSKKIRQEFLNLKSAAIVIQKYYKNLLESRKIRFQYVLLRNTVIHVQNHIRRRNVLRKIRHAEAARRIQTWYKYTKLRNKCRNDYLEFRDKVIIMQSVVRMHIKRKQYMELKRATITIQRTYKLYKIAAKQRQNFIQIRSSVIKIQAYVRRYIQRKHFLRIRSAALFVQALYRLTRHRRIIKQKMETAAICIQRNVRRYLAEKWYTNYMRRVKFIQVLWREKLKMRSVRKQFLIIRQTMIKFQAIARGYLVRKQIQYQKENLKKVKEERRQNWAASKIQALFRGHRVRLRIKDNHVGEARHRIKDALQSTGKSLRESNEEAVQILLNFASIETVIRIFRSFEFTTEVYPMIYDNNTSVVQLVYDYISLTNRSISSIELLKSAAAILVNLTRYKITGPKLYKRDRISPIIKFMWRYSNSETQLFCIFSTYLWLFSKYDKVKQDLTEFLHIPENHKILVTIKGNVERMKRMEHNTKNRFHTPQTTKFISRTNNLPFRDNMNQSLCSNFVNKNNIPLPTLEPFYGSNRADNPKYFEDAQQAINCLFKTYKL
ncbi:protein abnormal spindle [Battus philenor]|uniref:protein abnormal spindle n=1 Tax=Battus philenor TaxID=42288 RepID=UPI0035CF68DD